MTDVANDLTIIVPTRNRPGFLRRLLRYFVATEVASKIVVVDSSTGDSYRENQLTVDEVRADLSLEHVFDDGGILAKCRRAVESVDTPYCVFCADDDFLLIDSALSCVEFLVENEGYSCATGIWVSLNPKSKTRCYQTRCYSIDQPDPLVRFRTLRQSWFSTFYCVYRSDVAKRIWQVVDQASDYDRARMFPEALLGQLGVLYGRVKVLPCLHLLYQMHEQNEHRLVPWIQDRDSKAELFERFSNALSVEMVDTTGMSMLNAREIVHQEFSSLLDEMGSVALKGTLWQRLSRNCTNQLLLLRDRLTSNPVDIRLRRPLRAASSLASTKSWQLADELATKFPEGLEAIDEVRRAA